MVKPSSGGPEVCLNRRLIVQRGMGPLRIVEVDPVSGLFTEGGPAPELVDVYAFVFKRPPEALDEYVVHPGPLAVHGYLYTVVIEHLGEGQGGELASPV